MRKPDPKDNHGGPPGHSRRSFLRGSGLAAASAVLTGGAAAAIDATGAVQEAGPKVVSGAVEITLEVNGQEHKATVEPRTTLLDTLR
ncbi:MAG: (2Fe-2S)-binding protein, partial [Isosphaeraceae bacterium]